MKSVEERAFELVVRDKLSPEKAFKTAVKELKRRGNLEAFRKFLRDYYYLSTAYPGRTFRELFELSRSGEFPFTPPRWVEERARRKLAYRKDYWIRVNTLKADVKEVEDALRELGIEFEVDKDFPFFLKVRERPKLSNTELFRQGKAIPQDKSSAFVVKALDPKPGELVFDIGSAPGMKASLIQQVRGNRGEVVALDISEKRVKEERELLKLLGVEGVELVVGDGMHLPFRKLTKVLVDAPCSNSGTYVEDPSVFLRVTPKDVRRFSVIQTKILAEVMRYRPEKVVYSVCSVFPDEGEKVVEKVVKGYSESHFRLYPDRDGTDGFFISEMTRVT